MESNVDVVVDRILDILLRGMTSQTNVDWKLTQVDMTLLCHATREMFLKQPMLLEASLPMNICGDIHGQYYDLLRIFEDIGAPSKTRYMFMGDYVDRGKHSTEVICILFALKLKFPNDIFLLRGNHECGNVTKQYGFYDECKRRYSVKMWRTFIDVFNCMPVAAVVGKRIFCVHGGISPDMDRVQEINNIRRPVLIPDDGVLCDLLWSDPDPEVVGWAENDRGVSYLFGCDIINKFLDTNGLELLCRAHQVVEDGYEFICQRKCITIFSAPSYMGEFDNAGAVLQVEKDLRCRLHVYKALEVPKVQLPVKPSTPVISTPVKSQ